jgi:hypothetical protein
MRNQCVTVQKHRTGVVNQGSGATVIVRDV